MRARTRRTLVGVVATVATAAATIGVAPPAGAATRLEAENATLEQPQCGDGAAQFTHGTGTGETVLFMGGEGCTATFTAGGTVNVDRVRWYGGGVAGTICGEFGIKVGATEIVRSQNLCSIGGASPDDFKVATFPANSVPAGSYKLVWHPTSSTGHDAHVDWIEVTPQGGTTRAQAENATLQQPQCGDGAAQFTHGTGTGETVLFMGGEGCTATFSTPSTANVDKVRWYGGGVAGSICGEFGIKVGSTEIVRSQNLCSVGGASPDDFKVATFPANSVPAGSFTLVWHPTSSTGHDAHVDWIEFTTGSTPPPPPPPSNDNFANAVAIGAVPFSTTGSNANATRQSGEPQCSATGATVWYKWTAPRFAPVTADTIGSTFDTVLGVYTGSSVSGLTQVACDDNGSGVQSRLTFTATSGTTYYFQVGGKNGATGSTALNLAHPAGPANDNFAQATTLTASGSVSQSTANSSSEVGEPLCLTDGTTVWFKYTHSLGVARQMFANTFGSSFDTTLAVWSGSSLGGLTRLGCNDDARNSLQSQVGWTAQPNTTYYISAAGLGSRTGSLTARVVEGTLVALGDSVVAGHGMGPNPNGYPNNPTQAYPQLVGNALKLRVANLARSGSCASTRTLGDARTPASCDAKSVMVDQVNAIPFQPTHVVIGVGGNDIEFASCINAFMKNLPDADNPCKGQKFTDHLAALKVNLASILSRLNTLYGNVPQVELMGYYNPFSDAPTDPHQVCDMWMPAAIARGGNAMASQDHRSTQFRSAVLPVQHDAYVFSNDVVTRLNAAIKEVATNWNVTFVDTAPAFVGHDICATLRGGSVSDTWVWGPYWNDQYVNTLTATYNHYGSRAMPDYCSHPQSPGDDEQEVEYNYFVASYWMGFHPNCLAHPTASGHAALAELVKPTLRIT